MTTTSPSRLQEPPVAQNVAERDRWTTDPRPDIAADSASWSLLLGIAFAADGVDPNGAFGVLSGLRCCGCALERDERGRWRLTAGEMDAAEYAADRDQWLLPRRREVAEALRRLELVT